MKKPIYYLILLVMIILPVMACQQNDENVSNSTYSDFVSGIRDVLPGGWEMTVIDESGAMEPPHGLEEPLFRIDFVDPTHQFVDAGGRAIFPSSRLYFYDIIYKDDVLETIELEKMYSWDIPEYYDETTEYIIVTSPLYVNSGHYSDEATALYRPLDMALKEYFNSTDSYVCLKLHGVVYGYEPKSEEKR